MPSALVTGSNRGIGLEFVRQFAADGWRVYATCRDPARADDLKALKGDIRIHALDIGDFAAIDSLARALDGEAIDLLILNAAVYGPDEQSLENVDDDEWLETLRLDCIAQIRIARAFLDHVARSEAKKMIALTSRMGSIGDNTSGDSYAYRTGKAALDAAMKSLAIDLAPRGIVAAVVHPGWVKTEMGGPRARISTETSVSAMRKIIDRLGPKESGRFWSWDGTEIPW